MIRFLNNVSAEKRIEANRSVGVAPILIYGPVLDPIYFSPYTYNYEVYPGITLSAYAGEWSLSAGPQTLRQEWQLWGNITTILSASATGAIPATLLITEDMVGSWIAYLETATRGGLVNCVYTLPVLNIVADGNVPILNGSLSSFAMSANHRPGVSVPRPSYIWSSVIGLSTTRGNWYKNNINTNVSTYTYSNTLEGDTLYWSETAYDVLGNFASYAPDPLSVYNDFENVWVVSSTLYDVISSVYQETYSRTSSLSGGAQHMNVFSTKDHNTNTYVRNTEMWLYDKRDYLASVPVYKGADGERPEDYGGVLITPQHLLYCQHAHPHAANTWGVNPADSRPCIIKFVKGDNTVLSAIQVHQVNLASGYDLCVAVLDRNMQDQGLHPIPIMGNSTPYKQYTLYGTASSFPQFAISQGYNSWSPPWYPPVSNYPNDHDVMCYIQDECITIFENTSPFKDFDYIVYDGDSGTSKFVLYDDTIYLQRVILYGNGGGIQPGSYIDYINDAIVSAELSAISLGRLSATTGYTVSATQLF